MDTQTPRRAAPPDDKPFLELEASLEKAGRVEELIKLYEGRARDVTAQDAATLLTKAGELARDRLKNLARAEDLLRRALLFAPSHRKALLGLKVMYEQRQDHLGLVEILERLAAGYDGAEAAAFYVRAADLHEQKLGRKDRAILALQQATRSDPKDRQLFRRLRLLFLSEHRYESVLEAILHERAALGDSGIADELVSLAERLVDDPTSHGLAHRAASTALEIDPQNPRAPLTQKALQKFEHSWRNKAQALRTQSLEERDRKSAARHSLSVARLFAWYDSGSTAKLKEALERCFLLWPAMPEALELIGRIAERNQDYPSAVVQLEKMAQEAKDKTAQVDLWLRVGTLRLTRMEDRSGALNAFERAFQIDPARADSAGLYSEQLLEEGGVAEAVAALEKHLGTVKDRGAQVALQLRLADLCHKELKDGAGARAHLESALKVEPSNAMAAFQLAQLLAQDEVVAGVVPLLDLALCAPRSVTERVSLCEAVGIALEEAGQHDEAFRVLSRGLQLQPTRPMLLSSVVEQGRRAKVEGELAEALRRTAQVAPDSAAVEIWRNLAQLLQSPLARPQEALSAWEEVLQRAPSDAGAQTAISQLTQPSSAPARSDGSSSDAPDPVTTQQMTDPKVQLEIEARRLEGSAADPQAAAEVYRKILAIDPDDISALKRLGSAAAAMTRWEEVAQVAQRLASLSLAPADKNEWQARLAQLYAERLNRKDDAARLYLALLQGGEASAAVVGGLERLASSGVQQAAISQALAPHYAKSGDYQRQVASLLVQLSTAQDRGEKKQLLTLLARTHEEHLADPRAAFEFCLRGLSVEPADEHFRTEAVRLARDLNAHVDLARSLSDVASKVPDPALATALLQEAAEVADEAGAVDDAANALKAALEKTPDEPEILARLVQLYLKADRFSDCDLVLRRRILIAEGAAEKSNLYLRLAEISAALKRPREASQALQEAIKSGADELTHLPQLCDLLESSGRMVELSSALGRWIALAEQAGDKDLPSQLSLRRARVLEASLGDRAEALKNYSAILEKRPSDPDALAALEVLLNDPTVREEAARVLVPAYESIKEHRKLVAVLEVIASAAQDPLEGMLALKQAAYVHLNHLRQPELAFAALARAVRLAPTDSNLRQAARAAAEQADTLDAYAEVLSELVEAQPPQVRVGLHRELAELFEKLGERVQAVKNLRAAHQLDPKGIEVLRALQRLHRADEQWAELARALEDLATVVPEPGEKLALWREAAALHEQKLEDAERAAGCWRLIAERDPLDREAASALDRLYTQLDKPRELAFALELRRAQEGQSPQGRELAFRLAGVRQSRLADGPGALQLYRQIMAEDPSHAGTRDALEGWAKGQGGDESAAALEILDPALVQLADHARRISLREARMNGALPTEKARLSAEIRAIYERDLNQPERAFLSALRAFGEGIDRENVGADLERLAQLTGSFEELAEIYEEAGTEREGEAGVPMLRRAAEVREQLGQVEGAIKLWQEIQVRAPQDRQALDSLGKLFERSQNARSLSQVYARQAQLSEDPAERLDLLLKAGQAFEGAGDDEPAVDAFKSALSIKVTVEGLSALDRLYGKLHRVEEHADVVDQLATLATEPGEKRQYLLRRAMLLEKEGTPGEALNAFARVLAIAPQDVAAIGGLERLLPDENVRQEAARLLEPTYRSVNDGRKLVDLLEIRLPTTSGPRRLELIEEIATLREALGDKALAFAGRLRAFAENPGSPEVREALERLAAETGSFEELAAAYEDHLERGLPDALTLDLWRRLAALYGDRLNRPDLAAKAWTEVARRDQQDARALEALSAIYRKGGAYKELAQVMKRQVALEKNPAAQVQLLFELARLAEETLSDKPLAAQCYQAIMVRKPDDRNAIKFLGRVLAETDRHPELATLIAREIQLAETQGAQEEALELKVRLGRLRLSRLNDPRGALEIFQEVLGKKAGHAGAVGALEEMARSESPLRGEAATALEPVFQSGGEHLKLVQMLEQRVSAETVPQERAALLRRMADLYAGQMENPEMAFLSATRALREAPDDAVSLDLCLALAGPAEATEELEALLEEAAEKAADDAARLTLYRALARTKTASSDEAGAQDSWRRVMELEPQDPEALDRLSTLFAKGNPGELLEVLHRRLNQAEEPEVRARLLLQVGDLQSGPLADPAGALATYRQLVELTPTDPTALSRMEEACESQQRWPELADVLSRRIELLSGEEAQELKLRLAVTREEKLHDKPGAVALYTEILASDPASPGALTRLEALLEKDASNRDLSEVLMRAYRTHGAKDKLAAGLEARINVSGDAYERKDLLVELGGLREQEGELEMAFLALFRAFKEDPNDALLRAGLEKVADAAEAWDELVGAYEEELPVIAEAKDAAAMNLKLGQVVDQHLDDPERAIAFYEKARTQDPEQTPRVLPALERLYGKLERHEEHAAALEALAEAAPTPAEKVKLFTRLGQLAQEKLQSSERAALAYEKVILADKTQLTAARALEQIYESAAATDKLYAILKHQQGQVTGAERDRVLSKMAQVSAEGLSDVGHSIELYRELLSKNPRNDQAFSSLESLLERAKRFDELRELLTRKLAQTLDPRELVKLNDKVGRVVFRLQEKPEEAIPFFKAALDRDARHKGALDSLREIYDGLARKDDLVTVLRRLVALQEKPEGVKAIRIRLAEVLSELGRREEALDAARRALEVEPHRPEELERVQGIFMALRAYNDAGRALELKSQAQLALELPQDAVQTLFQVVDLWRGPGNRSESAGPALEKILELDPANRKAYELAVDLFSSVNDWRSYARVVDGYLPNLVTEEEKIAALRDLAKVQEQKLNQKDMAFMAACRALQLNAADPTIRDEVERLADDTGSHDELATVYEDVADSLPRGPLAEQLYLKLAQVQDQKLDEPAAAEASLRKILEFDPTNGIALDRLADIFGRRGRFGEYVMALEQKLETAGSVEQRKAILREIASVQDLQAKDPEEAAGALLRALELDPDADTLGALVSLYRREKKWMEAANALLRLRDLAGTPEERGRIQLEVGHLYEREVADDESAIEAYAQVLEFDPGQGEALDALERLYTKADRPAELLGVYERQLELTPDWRERVKILFKSAAIWEEKYQNLENAAACVESILGLESSNLDAVRTLERLRRTEEKWDHLVLVLERHAELADTAEEKAALLVELGDVWHQQLRQVDRAVDSYSQALSVDPGCRPAMHALGNLYERSGNWPFAIEMLSREAQAANGAPESVELFHRMGKINEDMLQDGAAARACYEQALGIDSGYLPAIRALKGIHQQSQDWQAYEQTLVNEAEKTEDPESKGKAYLEVARYHAETRDDREAATPWFEAAMGLIPELAEAARPLADVYVSREDWANAERMLDVVARRLAQDAQQDSDGGVARELCRQLYRLGYVSEKLGNKEKALGAYERAYQLDATYLPALEGLGNLLVQVKRFEEALKIYQSILIHHRDDLTDLEVVEVYWQIGDIHSQQHQYDRAQNHFEKALAIDPGHDPSLRALVQLADAAGRYDKAAEYRQALVQSLEGDARFAMYVELGILARDMLKDPYMAIDAYVGAWRMRPESLDVLDALYGMYRETKQGKLAAEILEKMLAQPDLAKQPAKAKRVYFALGEISRDETRDLQRAMDSFNAALDLDPRFLEAFSALEAMLGGQKEWKLLEENYARMIQRLPKSEETHAARMTLWRALGELYLKVLKHPEGALMAYQVVAAGMPDDAPVQETYAALAAQTPGQEEKAVGAYRRALAKSQEPARIVSALAELGARMKDYDTAYLAAQVAQSLVGQLGDAEREILAKLTPYAKRREVAQKSLTDRQWQTQLFHPSVRPLAEVMGLLFNQAGHLYSVAPSQYQVNPKKHRIDVAGAQEYQIHHYRYVAKLLGMEAIELYSPYLVATRERMAKRSNDPAPDPLIAADILQTHPPALRVGGKYFGEPGQKEVQYLLARTMALLRPELVLTQRLSPERLEAVLQAAITLSVPSFRPTVHPQALDGERQQLLKAVPEPMRAQLARAVAEYLRRATPGDFKAYLEGAELTATRCGLLVASDLEPVKKMVVAESGAAYRVSSKVKLRELMTFALSEDLHALRAAVGISVEVQLPSRK